jgi:hypothetical protein
MDWMPVLSKVLEAILIAILPPLAVALVGLVVSLVRKWWIEAKLYAPTVTSLLEEAVKLAVRAAEQAGAAELIKDKKQYAIEIAEKWLEARGLTVDIDLLDAAIEAAVLTLFNKPKAKTNLERWVDEG